MQINILQNNDRNIKRLAAQRQLYSDAKIFANIQYIIHAILLVILGILSNSLPKEYMVYIIICSLFIVLIDELVFTRVIDRNRILSAKIQEKFDCEVLEIQPNVIKYGILSFEETINEYYLKYLRKNKNLISLMNWYPGMNNASGLYLRTICQRTNIWWNENLREDLGWLLNISFFIGFLILFLISIYKGLSLIGFIVSVISPLFPSFLLLIKFDRDNRKAVEKLINLKTKFDEILLDARYNKDYNTQQYIQDTRNLQDVIFEIRSVSPLIPDFIYFKKRDKYEMISKKTNFDYIEQLSRMN